jgi:heterodisulfide reductase subunit C
MTNWGYQVQKDRQIDFDANSHEVYAEVGKWEPSIKQCISCGTCAAACSAAVFTDFSLRKIILLVRRGELLGLESELTKCMLCGKCQLACPRGVNTRNVILQIGKALQKFKS